MASASKQNPSSSKPPRHPFSIASSIRAKSGVGEESQFRNPNNNPSTSVLSNSPISMSTEDQILRHSTHLTRPELLRRRSHNLKQLAKCYRDHYWALMEDLKAQHREYYWKYGVSPFKEENQNKRRKIDGDHEIAVEGSGDNDNNNGVKSSDSSVKGNCVACGNGCKSKAMPLTNYCQLHILSDKKQKLYTSCTFVNKRAQSKAITCPKPTLASTVPALCNAHFQKAQKDVARALKDAGSSTNKPPPKLHYIVAAFVHHIQAKRKDPRRESKLRSSVKEEITS
ncbi:hypothetical protein N665_0139s0002 [Sinapis alba]|nr:hypothetical protein N665_0139s0002 [Sinapis alba]